jgi:TonB family protein
MKTARTATLASLALLPVLVFSSCATAPMASAPPVALPMPGPLSNVSAQDFEVSELDEQPVPIFQTRPIYPVKLRNELVSGQTIVGFIIDKHGNVVDAYVVSATEPQFGDAAVASVFQWKFRPGIKNGHAVNTRLQVPINFAVKSS